MNPTTFSSHKAISYSIPHSPSSPPVGLGDAGSEKIPPDAPSGLGDPKDDLLPPFREGLNPLFACRGLAEGVYGEPETALLPLLVPGPTLPRPESGELAAKLALLPIEPVTEGVRE